MAGDGQHQSVMYQRVERSARDIKPNPRPFQNGLQMKLFTERDDIQWVLERSELRKDAPEEVQRDLNCMPPVTGVIYICVNEDFAEEIWVTWAEEPNHLDTLYTRIYAYVEPKEEDDAAKS